MGTELEDETAERCLKGRRVGGECGGDARWLSGGGRGGGGVGRW